MVFKKYFTIIKASWQKALVYRFSAFSYRIGEAFEAIILIMMWSSIYSNQQSIKGFTLKEMLTYIMVGNLFNGITRNFLSDVVSQDIREGRLSNFLVKPISYFEYIISREIGRITIAFFMSFLTQIIIIFCFSNLFIFNFSPSYLFLILIMLVLAFVMELLISFLIGLISFWIEESGGVYSTIDRLRKFFSGGYFPLNLLPVLVAKISFFMPFAYSVFIPSQLYLKKINFSTGLLGIAVQLIWIIFLFYIIKFVWVRGIKKYEGIGI